MPVSSQLPVELWTCIFGYLHIGHIVDFSATCKYNSLLVRHYILSRHHQLAAQFFHDPDKLYRLLYTCQAVISGSGALYLLQPLFTASWMPNNLDIYVSSDNLQFLLSALSIEGYWDTHAFAPQVRSYKHSHVLMTITLARAQQTIDVVVTATYSTICPIFLCHSTLLMNFITHDALYCAYPRLTLCGLSLIHPFVAYDTILNRASIDTLLKYHRCEFTYLTCYHVHHHFCCFKHNPRKLHDKYSMWVITRSSPFAPRSHPDTYARLGIVDAKWCLGGELCSSDSKLASSTVHVLLDSE